jgi:hypothetical protein
MRVIILFAFAVSSFAADASKPPELSDKQKIAILTAQRDLMVLQAERNALESRLKDLNYSLIPQGQKTLQNLMTAAAPLGYETQPDLTLKAIPNPAPEKK